MSTQEVVTETSLAVASATPAELLRVAVTRGDDIQKLEKLMELQDKWERRQAEKAFIEALSAFKAHDIHIHRDKTNNQYASRYVSLGNLVATVTPYLSQHDLSVRWDIEQSSQIKITCILTHAAGHSESVSMVCPPDTSGAKNPIQQIKSAITYGKACTFESICGLASSDANVDDDGNAVGPKGAEKQQPIAEDRVVERIDAIKAARNVGELQEFYLSALNEAQAVGDQQASLAYSKARNARHRELVPMKGGAR